MPQRIAVRRNIKPYGSNAIEPAGVRIHRGAARTVLLRAPRHATMSRQATHVQCGVVAATQRQQHVEHKPNMRVVKCAIAHLRRNEHCGSGTICAFKRPPHDTNRSRHSRCHAAAWHGAYRYCPQRFSRTACAPAQPSNAVSPCARGCATPARCRSSAKNRRRMFGTRVDGRAAALHQPARSRSVQANGRQ